MSPPTPTLRYYASGSHRDGSTGYGIPIASLAGAIRLCQERHAMGYRKLRIYDRCVDKEYRYHITFGLLEPRGA